MLPAPRIHAFCLMALLAAASSLAGADFFSVGTYNLENYVDAPSGNRPLKSASAKAGIRQSIVALRADVLALQEIGGRTALRDLLDSLRIEGLDYPHSEFVLGFDTNVQVAVASRFPIIARRSHTNANFLLNGRRLRTSRGIAEVDIQVAPTYAFTLLTAHLKSRRIVTGADHNELREQEALVLREKIDARLESHPNANLIVLGDFNDVKSSKAIRILLGRGRDALVDLRPAERNEDSRSGSNTDRSPRDVSWTHYYGVEDNYSRIDYILVSRGMARERSANGTFVLALPNWGVASDHRPLVARFFATDR